MIARIRADPVLAGDLHVEVDDKNFNFTVLRIRDRADPATTN
jgi:hypothetical protein